jgi:hypothetical protein
VWKNCDKYFKEKLAEVREIVEDAVEKEMMIVVEKVVEDAVVENMKEGQMDQGENQGNSNSRPLYPYLILFISTTLFIINTCT